MIEKAEKIGIVILIGLLILIAGVEGFCLIKYKNTYEECKKNKEEIVYKSHEYFLENIVNEMSDYVTLKEKGLINGGDRLVLIISSNKDLLRSTVMIEYYDENDKLVKTDNVELGFMYKDNDFVLESETPRLSNVFSGKIVVKIDAKEPTGTVLPGKDRNKISLNGELKGTEIDNEYIVNVTGNNSLEESVNYLTGYALLYKDDRMIESTVFNSIEPIASNTSFSLDSIKIYSEEKIDYDDIKIVINYLY